MHLCVTISGSDMFISISSFKFVLSVMFNHKGHSRCSDLPPAVD